MVIDDKRSHESAEFRPQADSQSRSASLSGCPSLTSSDLGLGEPLFWACASKQEQTKVKPSIKVARRAAMSLCGTGFSQEEEEEAPVIIVASCREAGRRMCQTWKRKLSSRSARLLAAAGSNDRLRNSWHRTATDTLARIKMIKRLPCLSGSAAPAISGRI